MNDFGYEASWRRFVKIFVLVLLAWLIGKAACASSKYVGMKTYQYAAAEYGVAYADQLTAKYEDNVFG